MPWNPDGSHSSGQATITGLCQDEECLRDILSAITRRAGVDGKPVVAGFDTETTMDPDSDDIDHARKMVGFSLYVQGICSIYVPVGHRAKTDLFNFALDHGNVNEEFARWFLQELVSIHNLVLVIHNAKFDIHTLRNFGIDPLSYKCRVEDTMLLSFMLDSERMSHGLDGLLQEKFDAGKLDKPWEKRKGSRKYNIPVQHVSPAEMAPYAIRDTEFLPQLAENLKHLLYTSNPYAKRIFEDLMMPVCMILEDMENTGIRIDRASLKKAALDYTAEQDAVKAELATLLQMHPRDIKVNSSTWLSAILVDDLKWWGLPHGAARGKQGDWSMKKEFLQALEDGDIPATTEQGVKAARLILKYRSLGKVVTTYSTSLVEKLDADGRIHGEFKQNGARTGRFSSKNPNLQNIPSSGPRGKLLRGAFIARPGWVLVDADYAALEMRILADESQDPGLLEAFRNGYDPHQASADRITAKGVPCDRKKGKTVNFGIAYGEGAAKLSRALGFEDLVADPGSPQNRLAKMVSVRVPQPKPKVLEGLQPKPPKAQFTRHTLAEWLTQPAPWPTEAIRQAGADMAQELLDAFFEAAPLIRDLRDRCIDQAKALGYAETRLHRRRMLPGINAPDYWEYDTTAHRVINRGAQARSHAERAALNTRIQGTAADIACIAMKRIFNQLVARGWLHEKVNMLSQVHDELIFEVKDDGEDFIKEVMAMIKHEMENSASWLTVPLVAEPGYGLTWADAK